MKKISLAFTVILAIVLMVVGRALYYYGGRYRPPPSRLATPSREIKPGAALAGEFAEGRQQDRGVVLLDLAHRNDFAPSEIHPLLSQIRARGYTFEQWKGAADLGGKLKYVEALVIISPRGPYSARETERIRRFVEKGGRLLLVSDPTRDSDVGHINGLATGFEVIFEPDYLYNMKENQGNHSYIILRDFGKEPLFNGLKEAVFFAARSLTSPGHELVLGDGNTFSSLREAGRRFAVAAMGGNGRVLAFSDLTFMTEPYNVVRDNALLVSRAADFLTSGQRRLTLADFPYLFAKDVDLVYSDPVVFNKGLEGGVKLKELFAEGGTQVRFREEEDSKRDTFFVGLFQDAKAVEVYLRGAGITLTQERRASTPTPRPQGTPEAGGVSGWVKVKGLGELAQDDASLLYLHEQEGRRVLILLSDTDDTLKAAVDRLVQDKLEPCLLSDNLAYCREKEFVRPKVALVPGKVEKVLIVSDDDTRGSFDNMTGLADLKRILEKDYQVTVRVESQGERPSLRELRGFDAVVWTTGDFWSKAPDEIDALTLQEYVVGGGKLFITGGWIGFDWRGTEFYREVCHAEYDTYATQVDVQVADLSHPLARGFRREEVINFVSPPSGKKYNPDVPSPLGKAKAVFVRGPGSDYKGRASLIAYEDEKSKVAYLAFPAFLLPKEDMEKLVKNVLAWFGPEEAAVPTVAPLRTPEREATPRATPVLTPRLTPRATPTPTPSPTPQATPSPTPTPQ